MTLLSKENQNGRSMVEMLGVLAIIGVLSVGGISGYSKAMAKYKLTKTQDQISMLLMNIRTAYATSPNYDGLTNENAIAYNIAPGDMVPSTETGASGINHAFGGAVTVNSCNNEGTDTTGATAQYFYIQLTNLGNEACFSLLTSDWGTDGLVSMSVTGSGGALGATSSSYPASVLPISLSLSKCGGKGSTNTLKWVYY